MPATNVRRWKEMWGKRKLRSGRVGIILKVVREGLDKVTLEQRPDEGEGVIYDIIRLGGREGEFRRKKQYV